MAYVFDPTLPVGREVRRVARERLADAIATLDGLEGASPDEIEQGVHDVRKRCKEVRALARLVRPSLGKRFERFNDSVRAAADELAAIRDAHALLATFDDLLAARGQAGDPDLDRIRSAQAAMVAAATQEVGGGDPRIQRARQLLADSRRQVKRWQLDAGFGVLRAGLEQNYRRGRRALRRGRADPTDEAIHEWRKAVKTLWYHTRLIERTAPSVLEPVEACLDDLAEALGDDHDLAVLVEQLVADPERYGGEGPVDHAISLARTHQDELRRRAFRLGATVYAERPSAFAARMEAYARATVQRGPELATGGIVALAHEDEQHRPAAPKTPPTSPIVQRRRKFVVEQLPELPETGLRLRQGYLAIDGSVSVRVRAADSEGCTLTVKSGRGAVRTALEWSLTDAQFEAAWEQTRGRRIHKTRHLVPHAGQVVELDVFHDALDGLVLAEVEFDNDESMTSFRPPPWFGREVTDDIDYSNASLAAHAPLGHPRGTPEPDS